MIQKKDMSRIAWRASARVKKVAVVRRGIWSGDWSVYLTDQDEQWLVDLVADSMSCYPKHIFVDISSVREPFLQTWCYSTENKRKSVKIV